MEDINKLGEVFYNRETINLQKTSIIQLEKKLEEISVENKNVKNSIIEILEEF